MQMLPRSRPENIEDLTVQVAIVRPGPIQGGAVHPYLERASASARTPATRSPTSTRCLEPILSDTLGAIVFQDQVIQVAMALAGFSSGEAEGLRRAMSRKRSEEAMQRTRERFVEGAISRGVDRRGRRAGLQPDPRLLRLRLPEVARGRLRAARLPVDLAAGPLRARVPLLAAQRAADGLLPAGRARPRGAAARDRGADAGREPQRRPLPRRAGGAERGASGSGSAT